MTLLSTLATVFGTLMGLANLPQAYKIFKRKSAKDISIITYSLIFAGSVVWLFYGLELMNWPLIVTYILGILCIGLVIIGWIKYGR